MFFISFYKKKKRYTKILPPLHIDNVPVKREFVTKFFGVYLDENISWKHHINIVSTKKSIRVLEYVIELAVY